MNSAEGMEKLNNLNSELANFKKQQEELIQKMEEQGITPEMDLIQEPVLIPIDETSETKENLNQVSPSTFELNNLNIPSAEDIENGVMVNEGNVVEEKQEEEIQEEPTYAQPLNPLKAQKVNNTDNTRLSKAELALATLEEEILTNSVEIYLPGLKENVTIKPLKNIEELNLKTQNLSFGTFLRQINLLLLKKTKINEIPILNYFKTVEEFEEKILPVDRLLLLFGLIKNSFENLTEFQMVCENCEKEFLAKPSVENLFFKYEIDQETSVNTDYYTYSDTKTFLNGKLEIDFGYNPEAVRIKMLKYKSNEEIRENVEKNNILDNVDNLTLFVKRIRVYKEDKRTKSGKKLITEIDYYKDGFDELFNFIHDMPMKLKDVIAEGADLTNIEKFSPVFKISEVCPYCGHVHEMDISPEIEFFRKALSLFS